MILKILAVDTSSKICSVSILEDTKVLVQLHNDDEKTHSVKLMPMIDEAFSKSCLCLDDIDLLACCIGPGSFTGVRIGIATIKAFADAKNIPTIGVSSLEGLAYHLVCSSSPICLSPNNLVCSMIDAKNNQVYCGCYSWKENQFHLVGELMADDISIILEKINLFKDFSSIYFVGDGAILHQESISQILTKLPITFLDESYALANSCSIANCAYLQYKESNTNTTSSLSPLYLRKSQAERMLEEKEKKNC